MATVNLGRIKPVFRGAYSGSTAYVVDDIVTHGNESFICIQAHGAGTQATTQTAPKVWTVYQEGHHHGSHNSFAMDQGQVGRHRR